MSNKILKQIHQKLLKNKKTISIAESCTGGQLSSRLTSLPGSSGYFILGVVTYSNKSKQRLLKIPAKTISRYGAVSRQVAMLMAKNIRKKMHTDFALSITGIAGPLKNRTFRHRPSSKTNPAVKPANTKPVGTVFIALNSEKKSLCRLFLLSGKRENIRSKSTHEALRLLNQNI